MTSVLRVLTAVSVILALQSGLASSAEETNADDRRLTTYLIASPDLMSAYYAAFEAHASWWEKQQGHVLTAQALSTDSWAIEVKKLDNGDFRVHFYPPLGWRGGGIGYLVDGKSFKVVSQDFTR